jgi:periodic tryptophan protein 2
MLVHVRKGTVLHRISFKKAVNHAAFSPDGKYIAVTHGNMVQVWTTPSALAREFAPFTLHREYTGHHDDVVSIAWSKTSRWVRREDDADDRYFITTSRDMTARLYTLNPVEGFKPKTFGGHRDVVVGAYFSDDERTVSHNCRHC